MNGILTEFDQMHAEDAGTSIAYYGKALALAARCHDVRRIEECLHCIERYVQEVDVILDLSEDVQ